MLRSWPLQDHHLNFGTSKMSGFDPDDRMLDICFLFMDSISVFLAWILKINILFRSNCKVLLCKSLWGIAAFAWTQAFGSGRNIVFHSDHKRINGNLDFRSNYNVIFSMEYICSSLGLSGTQASTPPRALSVSCFIASCVILNTVTCTTVYVQIWGGFAWPWRPRTITSFHVEHYKWGVCTTVFVLKGNSVPSEGGKVVLLC